MAVHSIFLIGRFGPGDLGTSYERGFRKLGLHTHSLDMSEAPHHLDWPLRNRITYRLTANHGSLRALFSTKLSQWIESAVLRSGAQVLLALTMELIQPATVENLRKRGIKVVFFYPDNPFPPHYSARPETLPAARAANLCLVWSERLVEKLHRAGIPHAAFLPFAWDPEVFPYQDQRPQGTWPGALFLGGWDREREAFLEEIAHSVPLRIYGPEYWKTRTRASGKVRHCWQGSDLRLDAAARVIRDSAVCLNVLRGQHIIDGTPDGLIMRHFEVPGAGGFLLSTRSGGATTLFPEGESGMYFSDTQECVAKIRYFLAHEQERKDLAAQAHEVVAKYHLYPQRARQILNALEALLASS